MKKPLACNTCARVFFICELNYKILLHPKPSLVIHTLVNKLHICVFCSLSEGVAREYFLGQDRK